MPEVYLRDLFMHDLGYSRDPETLELLLKKPV